MAKTPAPKDTGLTVDVNQLAYFWKCDVRTVQIAARMGHAIKAGHGKYQLAESNREYVDHLRKLAASHKSADGTVDAVFEAAMLRRAQREAMELRRDEIAGKLINIPALEELWGEIIRGFRNIVLSIPTTIMFDLPHIDKHDIDRIKGICREMLKANSIKGMKDKVGPLPKANVEAKDLEV